MQFRQKSDIIAKDVVEQLRDLVLEPLNKRNCKAADVQRAATKRRDAERLTKVAPPGVYQDATRQAMADLRSISDEFANADAIPEKIRGLATSIMVGIVFTNGLAGRSQDRILRKRCSHDILTQRVGRS